MPNQMTYNCYLITENCRLNALTEGNAKKFFFFFFFFFFVAINKLVQNNSKLVFN